MTKLQGLSSSQVKEQRMRFGTNEIVDVQKTTAFTIFLRQIKKNFIIYLLIAATILSFLVGKNITAYTILGVIAIVIISGFIQEYKAEKAIESLKNMLMSVSIVIRNGKEVEIASNEIVPEDIIKLGSGEKVPADAVLIKTNELRLDESVLTGESAEIKKTETGEEDEKRVFMGTYVVNGRALAKVEHTGMNTRFGKIAAMITTTEKEMPLQKKINNISKYMVAVAIVASASTALLMLFRAPVIDYELISTVLILAIALCVSAFPEGFPVVLTTTLATGVARMAGKNAIVNRMSIIETLGETTVVCTDKTGTVTKGEMTVNTIFSGGKTVNITGSGYVGKGEFMHKGNQIDPHSINSLYLILKASVYCNDATIHRTGEDSQMKVAGTPTEGALLVLAAKAGIYADDLKKERVNEYPFSSDRKMMSTLMRGKDDSFVFAKGAPEVLIENCTHVKEGEIISKLTKEKRKRILSKNKLMNSKALRTLMFAYKAVDHKKDTYKEDDLIFLGLVGMEDPPRDEITDAIKECREAGITVKMITGDNKETALSISEQIDLKGKIIVGHQIDELSDAELRSVVKSITIFARVRPEHKLRIVKALKENGEIVTMTGDGVNDAPALKEAHIGVAMGKNGTDVTRSVSDLILKDDNFATIVLAVREGRTIFNNIRKFVSYQLSDNYAELFIILIGVLVAPIFGWAVPLLLALHILFMNLVTDNLPAITLGLNPYSKDVMTDPPRKNTGILTKPFFLLIVTNGTIMGTITLVVYYISFNVLGNSVEVARTTALICLIGLEIASAFNFRSFRQLSLTRSPFVNPYLVIASTISLLATLVVVYVDRVSAIFETTPVGINQWLTAITAGLILLIIFDILKYYSNKKGILLARLNKLHAG
jgi:P-type Ca2+ transporter type 2C